MDAKLDRCFPSLAHIEKQALRRLPKFIADYIYCGMGNGAAVKRNREALDALQLLPRYSSDPGGVDSGVDFLGRHWLAPFGIAPVGLGSFAWPRAAECLAQQARLSNIPFCVSSFALASLEDLGTIAGESAWFQLYRPNRAEIESDLVERAIDAGFQTLMVTVDIPAAMRRSHDIHNGFSIPPRFDWTTLWQVLSHPAWSLALAGQCLKQGFPDFASLSPYVPEGLDPVQSMQFKSDLTLGNIDQVAMTRLRRLWPGKLIVKGVLDPEDALRYRDWGADAILVSNHGGRQLEAAPSALQQLPAMRAALGDDYPLLADGGVRSGIDICRMLASGADFVLLGRPFYYAIAAMGAPGAAHIIALLNAELSCAMAQLGCARVIDLRERLH